MMAAIDLALIFIDKGSLAVKLQNRILEFIQEYDLLDADEVVFFGHSLGQNDYHYFRQFFRNQCDENMPREKGKKITIFTYDDSSRISILEQLRDMNDRKTSLLFSLNDFQVICTKDGKNERLLHFLKHLQQTSKEEELKRINRLASML